ncbi:hypothetical protein B0A49_07283 [Cryomyces minteri]|uniref:Solute carrier family 40 member n=1 Tax=Cryomyces minteri TaxID=331657 RepID=A0A4U0X360_9PEZI|nr:hypothetical protein B0A49_07283 [Cryomyces minteri]
MFSWCFLLKPDAILGSAAQGLLFAIVLLFGMLERLSNVANEITMDRNWLPLLASSSSSPPSETGIVFDLTHLNAVMLRIDLICKMVAPYTTPTLLAAASFFPPVKILLAFLGALPLIAELRLAR